MATVFMDEVLAVVDDCAKKLDDLAWNGAVCYDKSAAARAKMAEIFQYHLAALLVLLGKYGLAESGLHLYVGDGSKPLTKLEAVRQLLNGSTDPEAFGETLGMLGRSLKEGRDHE